jgi:DNA-binding protein Fis
MSGAEADAATVPSGEQLALFERAVTAALPEVVGEAATLGAGRVYRSVMARVELPLLRHVLTLVGGNQLKAARMLGINRNTLRKRLRLLGLLPPSRRNATATS